jgi:hypothetical protein
MQLIRRFPLASLLCLTLILTINVCVSADDAKPEKPKPEFPPLEKVTKDFTEVKTSDGSTPYMRLWKNSKTGQMLAELPKNYTKERQFIAPTVASGEVFAGLQSTAYYVYWKRYGKRIALVRENLAIKGSDAESKSSVDRLFTDRVLLSLPIVSKGKYGPVIDLDNLLVGNASTFVNVRPNSSLVTIKKAKAFANNVEVAFEVPVSGGVLKTIHYSISKVTGSKGYKPRKADERIGYFTTEYRDYGKYDRDDVNVRYINRWHLTKAKPNLRLSPPSKKIIFYIEGTTPVRYRRWVRKGILAWNKAFENIGIENAIEVRDGSDPEHRDKDPEDVRYNFVRWLNNNISTAIGPSRVNPLTGEILDADIVLTDGWIRVFEGQFSNMLPEIAMDGMTPETYEWFAKHPNWDPRVRLADPSKRDFVRQQLAYQHQQNSQAAKPWAKLENSTSQLELEGMSSRVSNRHGICMAAEGRRFDVGLMRLAMLSMLDEEKEDAGKDKKDGDKKDKENDEDKEQMLDGMPESFIGPLLANLVSHEVGHTLGLRHNFKASSVYEIAEMNSEDFKGKKTLAGSVMDYIPTNFKVENGEIQGDWAMIGVGPYDEWAIEYGYTLNDKKLPKILSRVAEPELAFCSDEDTTGPDPLARRYDFGKNPLNFAKDQVAFANKHRKILVDKIVKDGDGWKEARSGYLMTLGLQTKSVSMMANWLGGTYVHRDRKGDPNGRTPIEVVETERQRDAMNFVIDNTFFDDAYGLTPDLLNHMTVDYFSRSMFSEPAWPVHDRIMGIQATAMSQLLGPTTLRRIYDNEFRVPSDQDALTLKEVLDTVSEAAWKELDEAPKGKFTEREPAISSLRRNLQSEYIQRLFDLGSARSGSAAMKPISNLATLKLREIKEKLEKASKIDKYDAYTRAHLQDSLTRVEKWLEAQYVVSAN